MEAWGRKKRSIGTAAGGKQVGDDMTLSREIVVLDLKEKDPNSSTSSGDQATSGSEQQSSSGELLAQRSPLRAQTQQAEPTMPQDYSAGPSSALDLTSNKHCLSSQSLFVLICSIGFFFVLYVCVVAYFFARRDPKISPIKHQYHH